MTAINYYKNKTNKPIPKGITITFPDQYDFIIHHKDTGTTTAKIVLTLFCLIWGIACVYLLGLFLTGKTMTVNDSPNPTIPFCLVLIFWIAYILMVSIDIHLFFKRELFLLDQNSFIIQTKTLWCKDQENISKHSIIRFTQVHYKVHYRLQGTNSLTQKSSLILKTKNGRKIELINEQPSKKIQWLGQLFAQWANVKLESSEKIIYRSGGVGGGGG